MPRVNSWRELDTHQRLYCRADIFLRWRVWGALEGRIRVPLEEPIGASVASVCEPWAADQFRRFRRPTRIPRSAHFGGFVFYPILFAGCGRLAVSFLS